MSGENQKRQLKLDAAKVLQLISSEGILSHTLKGFEPRKPQQMMMANVIEAYNEDAITLIEAGTGTGKSLAYLLPAILWALEHKQRTLISTHTIALQEQLIQKDIPQIIKALNLDISAVLVKGMGNYLCLRKFCETQDERLLMTPEERTEFEKIETWAETTKEGSRTSMPKMPSVAVWERLSAESDTCTKTKCPHYQKCFFFKARRKAEEAQILVANHHLLFADLALRAETDNYKEQAILPAYTRVVIDEAHHIEDIATDFFGDHISKMGILRLLGRIASERQNKPHGKLASLKEKLNFAFPDMSAKNILSIHSRLNSDLVHLRREVQNLTIETFTAVNHCIERLSSNGYQEEVTQGETKLRLLPSHHNLPFWKEHIVSSANKLIDAILRYVQALDSLEKDLKILEHENFQEQSKGLRQDISAFAARLEEQSILLNKLILDPPGNEKVRWVEIKNSPLFNNVSIRDADLDISQAMIDFLFGRFSTIVLCSATLTTNRQFNFIRARLGLLSDRLPYKRITEYIYDSPFNYAVQALLGIPIDLPHPQQSNFIEHSAQQIWSIIEVSRGSTFVLFTSYTMMKACYEILAERLFVNRYSLFKQGDEERQALLSKFKTTPRAILFGTDSFWEGIDVAGDALRCVVIVKLPFKVPTEPIIQARTEAILSRGGDPFSEYTLPTAIVKFKQGFGRLIRHVRDRGCIVCLDTRLINKSYGKSFIDSLPKCQESFTTSEELLQNMRNFYKKTQYLVKQ